MTARLKKIVTLVAALSAPALGAQAMGEEMTFHDFHFTAIDGGDLPLDQFQGKAVLLVNTASFCGFTGQYADLQQIWRDYRDQGLVVLGVPSNDFGGQEPGTVEEIKDFCEANYDIDFPMTAKAAVIGADAHPLYRWIGAELGEGAQPKWNFHKYLFDRQGGFAGAWPSRVKPTAVEIRAAVEKALGS